MTNLVLFTKADQLFISLLYSITQEVFKLTGRPIDLKKKYAEVNKLINIELDY